MQQGAKTHHSEFVANLESVTLDSFPISCLVQDARIQPYLRNNRWILSHL